MGSYCSRGPKTEHTYRGIGTVTLGKLITMARGGDILLIQDQSYIDNYTMMNSQEAHYLKQHLRFSGKDNADRVVELWSRVAIVVDSELPDLKYILEVTEQGFQEYEFLSRMMFYKKDPERIVAYLRCLQPVSEKQSTVLTQACKGLQGKDWKKVYSSAPEWLQDLVQSALYESRVILNRFVGEESFVKDQLRKVFDLFTQTAGQTDEQL